MRIAVVGAGGAGGLVGARLSALLRDSPDHQVVLWCRGAVLDSVRKNGLRLQSGSGDLTVHPATVTHDASEAGPCDVVIYATKGYDLEAAAAETVPLVRPDTRVIPILNGISAPETLARLLPPCDVLSGCVYLSAHAEAPGVIRQTGAVQRFLFGHPGLGEAENRMRYADLERLLKRAGLQVTLTELIDVEVWAKFLFLSPLAALTALHGRSMGEILGDDEARGQLTAMICEAEDLARASGVRLPENVVNITLERCRLFPGEVRTSMQLDRERGRPMELETLVGCVCRQGRKLKVPTPTYDRVYSELKPQ